MRKPDWKVAVVGGTIAALGLGGFAAAQSGSTDTDTTVPEGIRLQRDASVSIHSLSSVVEVRPSTTSTTLASLASVDNNIPQVTPAPAAVDSWDSPASVQSIQSIASVQSVDSPASVQSLQSPASVQSLDSPASVQSVDSPDSVDSP